MDARGAGTGTTTLLPLSNDTSRVYAEAIDSETGSLRAVRMHYRQGPPGETSMLSGQRVDPHILAVLCITDEPSFTS